MFALRTGALYNDLSVSCVSPQMTVIKLPVGCGLMNRGEAVDELFGTGSLEFEPNLRMTNVSENDR